MTDAVRDLAVMASRRSGWRLAVSSDDVTIVMVPMPIGVNITLAMLPGGEFAWSVQGTASGDLAAIVLEAAEAIATLRAELHVDDGDDDWSARPTAGSA